MSQDSGTSSSKKQNYNKLDIARFIVQLLQLGAVVCAVVTLIFNLYPQLKPHNSNLVEMANAGDYESQIKLAHFSYETGDLSESVYWYKLAAINDMNSGKSLLALNNLAYLYSQGYGLATEALTEKDRLQIALSLFNKAVDTDCEDPDEDMLTAANNKYLLLITFGEDMFDRYDAELKSVRQFLREQNSIDILAFVSSRDIVSQDPISSSSPLSTGWVDDNTYVTFSGVKTTSVKGYIGISYEYIQTVYEEGREKLPELQYITP